MIFFKKNLENDPNYSEALEKIQKVLSEISPEQAKYLACFALLLGRIAYADHEVSNQERRRIQEILMTQGRLSFEQATHVEAMAIELIKQDQVEHHLVLRRLNEIASKDQKISIVRSLLYVASDVDISAVEDSQVGLIASGLLIPRAEFIQLRSEYRDYLSSLR